MDFKKFEISPIKDELRKLFFVTSDRELEAYIALFFHLDKSNNKSLKKQNQELYDSMLSGEFISEFCEDFEDKIDVFLRLFIESDEKVALINLFSNQYLEFLNRTSLNRSERKITFSNLYIKKVKNRLKQLEKELGAKLTFDTLEVKPQSRFFKNYYSLTSNCNYEDLRNSLIRKGLINAREVKLKTIENLFCDVKHKGKLNWIGGKSKLWCFIKIMKDENKISDKFVYEIAKNAFMINGRDLDKLHKPNRRDIKGYYSKLESMVRNHFG